MASAAPASTLWVANQAVYMPVSIPWQYPVARVFWVNGSAASSNADFGIYTPGGLKIYSTGSTAQSGASVPQYVTPGTPFLLDAGTYIFAWACNGTTNRAFAWAPTAATGAASGCMTQASAFALPSTATFATYGSCPGVVLCGVTRTASGF